MNILLTISNFLLEQTAQEKRLTILYIALFVVVVGMMFLDIFNMQKAHTKGVWIFLLVILVVAAVALVLLFVFGNRG